MGDLLGNEELESDIRTVMNALVASQPAWKLWTGRLFTAIPALIMLGSGAGKVAHPARVLQGFVGRFGYLASAATPIGIVEMICAVLYLVPRTRVLGAILMTGHLGGAVATHVRVGDASFVAPALLGVMAWGGLFLSDPRIQKLLPLVKE